jgi:acyl-CoA synthetase (AMP-forming)/AMP-acid ligase II
VKGASVTKAESGPQTLGAAIVEAAKAFGQHDYLICSESAMTYAEVERASADLARRMLASGIGKGTRVGLYFTYSHEWLISWLAAARIGALVMPFSTVYSPRELGEVLNAGDVSILITAPTILTTEVHQVLESALPSLAQASSPMLQLDEAPFLRTIWIHGDSDRRWASPLDLLAPASTDAATVELLKSAEGEVVPSDPAVVVYTSGSSAGPKGVVHTHRSILCQSRALAGEYREIASPHEPRILCGMPFFWVGGLLAVAGALHEPLTLVALPKLTPVEAMKIMERERVTSIMGWPTLIQSIRSDPRVGEFDLESARSELEGASDFAAESPLPGVPLHRGMSETMGTFEDVDCKVVDPETGLEVARGVEGELCVRGPGVMEGYYKRGRDEVFDADGWFHTGDRVVMIEHVGYPLYRGRYTEMIKSAGANVSPREVEMVIEELAGIRHCFVLGAPHATRGEEVVALVVPHDGLAFDEAEVAAAARANLSSYKVPSRWIVLAPDDVPWLGSGKPDKRVLTERFVPPSPAPDQPA